MKAIFTVGVSASGKSTWAREHCKATGAVEINRDDGRTAILMDEGAITDPAYLWTKWNFKREKEVNDYVDGLIKFCVEYNFDIVFSDTNLNRGRLKSQIARMKSLGYDCEIKYFPVDDIDVVIKRDKNRVPSVGESVIRKQWLQWLDLGEAVTGIKKYVPDTSKPRCVVVDIDGTVAKMVDRGPFDWSKVGNDLPRMHVLDAVSGLELIGGCAVIFLSGRDSVCRKETEDWIKTHFDPFFFVEGGQLFMRAAGDCRKDRVIKDELFWKHVAPRYNVVAAFDDRRQMVEYWTDIGVPLFNVGNCYDDF